MNEFVHSLEHLLHGYTIACKVCREFEEGVHYLIKNRHIGDAARNLKYVKAFKDYYSDGNKYHFVEKKDVNYRMFPKMNKVNQVIVITNVAIEGVAKLYEEVDEVIVLSQAELEDLELYANSSICCHRNLHPDERKDDWLKCVMFGIPSIAWELNVPTNQEQGKAQITTNSKEKGKKIIESLKILPEQTVIVFPHARSSSQIPETIWDKVIQVYKEKGYRVFTNVSPKEGALKNTERLQLSVDELVGVVSSGCTVIGIQSGLLDTLIWAGISVKMYIIFYVKEEKEMQFAMNRGVKEKITKKGNITYMLFENDTVEEIEKIVLSQIG